MVAEADDALMEKFFEAGTLTQDELTAGLGARGSRRQAVPGVLRVGPAQHRRPAARRRDRDLRAVAGRAAVRRASTSKGEAGDARGRRQRAARPLGLEDDRRSVRRPHHDVPRRSPASLKADATVHNVTRDVPERFGHVLALQGKTQTHVPELHAGDLGAVAKLKDTHTNDTLGDKAAGFTVPPIDVPGAGARRTRSSRRAAATRTRSARRCSGCAKKTRRSATTAIRRRTSCCSPGQGQLHIEVTVAKLRRRFGVEVNLKPPRIAVPRDDHRQGRGARPPQEADRRPRPVRRLQDHDGAAAARRGLRVRGRHLRRLDSAAVRAGGRKGHPGHARCAAIWPAIRSSISASRSPTARTTTSTRAKWRSGWPAGSRSATA